MAKYLTDISIESEYSQKFSEGFDKLAFNKTTKVVQDIFWYQIPSKFEFDGIGKLNIRITSTNPEIKYRETAVGYAQYTYGGFNFSEYFSLDQTARNLVILKILQEVILDVLKGDEEKSKELIDITNQIEANGFVHEVEDEKRSKWNRKRNCRAAIIYRIDSDGENAFLKLFNKSGNLLIHEHLLKNRVYDFHNNLFRTKWAGTTFQILKRNGEIFKEFDGVVDR